MVIWSIFPVLVSFSKKNLATIRTNIFCSDRVGKRCDGQIERQGRQEEERHGGVRGLELGGTAAGRDGKVFTSY
jgi:hypothetical protein